MLSATELRTANLQLDSCLKSHSLKSVLDFQFLYQFFLIQFILILIFFLFDSGDLIETFKILTGREHVNYSKFFELADVTSGQRGHSLKLFKPRCRTTVRQNFFSLWIVNEWNKLPQDVVEAPSINTFKNRLDRHWYDTGIQS